MLDVETIHPSFLSPADAALWRSLAASAEGFGNPLLGPEFAQAVGKVREDARVAVIRRGGETVGFLPFHRRPGGAGASDRRAALRLSWPCLASRCGTADQ